MAKRVDLDEILDIFTDYIDDNDVVSSALISQISAQLIKYRVEHNMSQQEFAKFLGISQAMVSKFESEDYNFTIKKLVELCHKIGKGVSITITDHHEVTVQNNYYVSTNIDDSDIFNGLNFKQPKARKIEKISFNPDYCFYN